MAKLNDQYRPMMKIALAASAVAGPLGAVTGPADMLAVTGIWTTLLIAMMKKADKDISPENAKTIAGAVAAGAVSYYVGCKLGFLFDSVRRCCRRDRCQHCCQCIVYLSLWVRCGEND